MSKGHDVAINGNAGDSMARPHGDRRVLARVQGSGRGMAGVAQAEPETEKPMIHLTKSAIATTGAALCGWASINAHPIIQFFSHLF